nr:uncharacterized protein LOC105883194 isoform X2 [Microcebus murinus]
MRLPHASLGTKGAFPCAGRLSTLPQGHRQRVSKQLSPTLTAIRGHLPGWTAALAETAWQLSSSSRTGLLRAGPRADPALPCADQRLDWKAAEANWLLVASRNMRFDVSGGARPVSNHRTTVPSKQLLEDLWRCCQSISLSKRPSNCPSSTLNGAWKTDLSEPTGPSPSTSCKHGSWQFFSSPFLYLQIEKFVPYLL